MQGKTNRRARTFLVLFVCPAFLNVWVFVAHYRLWTKVAMYAHQLEVCRTNVAGTNHPDSKN